MKSIQTEMLETAARLLAQAIEAANQADQDESTTGQAATESRARARAAIKEIEAAIAEDDQ